MALTLDGTTGISATGNIYGGNIIVTNALSVGNFVPTVLSSTGNVTGGNLLTPGVVSAAGNVTGNYVLGNGALLTGVITSVANINSGTSNVTVTGSGANITVGVGGTPNVAVFATTGEYITGILSATGNVTAPYFIGNGAALTGLSASKIYNGTSEANIGTSGGNANISIGGTSNVFVVASTGIYTTGLSSVTGNITGGNILTAGIMSSTGNATHGNLTVSTGTVTLGNIVNANGNAVGNIGSSSAYFNTIFGKATTAQYADLAELYVADANYSSGTVVDFGGANEITLSTQAGSARIAGVVSTNPAHLMNSTLAGENIVAVALTGRVPTSVTGTVRKGDMMVSAGNGHAQASSAPVMGTVIGKALEDFDGASGTIEIVVGRL